MDHDNRNEGEIEITSATKKFIIHNLIEPYYKNAIKVAISGKKIWRLCGISLETISKILVAIGGITSFSAGYYNNNILSFISGSISCMSLTLFQLSSFSYKENEKHSQELNNLLKKINLDTISEPSHSLELNSSQNNRMIKQSYCTDMSNKNSFQQMESIDDNVFFDINSEHSSSPPQTPESRLQSFNVSPYLSNYNIEDGYMI